MPKTLPSEDLNFGLAWWSEEAAAAQPPLQPRGVEGGVWSDADHDGLQDAGEAGVAGVTVQILDSGTLQPIDSRETDGSGRFAFIVDSAQSYRLGVVRPVGYVFSPQDALDEFGNPRDDIDSDVNTSGEYVISAGSSPVVVDAGLYLAPGSATIGDRVWLDENADGVQDPEESGYEGLQVVLKNSAGSIVDSTLSGTDGTYQLSATLPGDYSVEFAEPTGISFSTGNRTFYLPVYAGDAIDTVDAGVYFPGSVSGLAWTDANADGIQQVGEQLLENVPVGLFDENTELVAETSTDANGVYSFGDIVPGNYFLAFGAPTGLWYTRQHQGTNESIDSDANRVSGWTELLPILAGINLANMDAGYIANAPPVGLKDEYSIPHGVVLSVPAAGVLANDSDPESSALTAVVDTGPSHGTLTLSSDGSFTYTPEAAFAGIDVFFYRPVDQYGAGDLVVVTIDVTNQAPVAVDDEFTTDLDTAVSGNVLDNDTDADNDPLTAAVITEPSNGSLIFNPDGTFEYTPNTGWSGTDSFTYEVDDGFGGIGTATATITVSEGSGGSGGSISGLAWEDSNRDGIRDPLEDQWGRWSGVQVNLLDEFNNVIDTAWTNEFGEYSFQFLGEGTYRIEFVASGMDLTLQDQGSDDAVDSDANQFTGLTEQIILAPNQQVATVDVGLQWSDSGGGA